MNKKCSNTLEVLYVFSVSLVLTTLIFLPLTSKNELTDTDIYHCLKDFSQIDTTPLIDLSQHDDGEVFVEQNAETQRQSGQDYVISSNHNNICFHNTNIYWRDF